jgi:hypothetical protein
LLRLSDAAIVAAEVPVEEEENELEDDEPTADE